VSLLEISGLSAGYGGVAVVRDLSLRVDEGEAVALVGANAAGKTTLLRAITGIVHPYRGSIRFDGADLTGASAEAVSRVGIAQVAEGRQLFPDMSVRENLELGEKDRHAAFSLLIERNSKLAMEGLSELGPEGGAALLADPHVQAAYLGRA